MLNRKIGQFFLSKNRDLFSTLQSSKSIKSIKLLGNYCYMNKLIVEKKGYSLILYDNIGRPAIKQNYIYHDNYEGFELVSIVKIVD